MPDRVNIILQWDEHNQTQDIQSLWESQEFLDVTLVCDDDDQVEAHKLVLSAASPFLRKILQRNPHSHPLLYLRGATKKDIQALLLFIYSGETQVMQEELESFMSLANNLQVQGLVGEYSDINEDDVDDSVRDSYDDRDNQNLAHKFLESTIEKSIKLDAITEKIDVHIIDDDLDYDDSAHERDVKDHRNKENLAHNFLESTIEASTKSDTIAEKVKVIINDEKSGRISRIISEYENILFDLVSRIEGEWMCKECPFKSSNKNHALDHAEKHIKGFSLECKFCDKTFKRKTSVRQHIGRWHKEELRNVGRPKITKPCSTM